MHKVVKNRIIRARQKSSQQIWSIVLVALSIFFIVLGGLGLLYVQQPLRENSFDTRRDASVADGPVEITTTYVAQTANTPEAQVLFKFNSSNQPVTKMELVFNVISDTFSQETNEVPVIHTNFNGASMKIIDQEMEKTVDGYLVSMVLEPKQGTSVATQTPTPFARLDFVPQQSGTLTMSFDPATSKVFVAGAPTTDKLRHIPSSSQVITVAEDGNVEEKIFFEEASHYSSFHRTDGTNIPFWVLERNQNYRIKTYYKLNNLLKVSGTPPGNNPKVMVVLRVQGSERQSKEIPYSTLTRSSDGHEDLFEFDFTPTTTLLKIELLAYFKEDTAETATTNRAQTTLVDTWSITYDLDLNGTGGTADVDVKSCNEKCSSNAECPSDHRCYKDRCRLVTNLSSSSCTNPPDQGLQRTCNQYCADTRECAAGYSCYFNRCRRPDNLESTVCAMPPAALQQAIKDSCNDSCRSNGDCANNMRCFNGACRLATNPSSTSCTAATQPTVSGKYYSTGGATKGTPGGADTATRSATPRPATGSATARPSTISAQPASPAAGLVSPRPTPSPSPQGDAIVRVSPSPLPTSEPTGNFFQRLTRSGISFPLIALTIGVIILLGVGIMTLLNVLKKRAGGSASTVSAQKKTAYEDELQQRINTLRQQQAQTGTTAPPSPATAPVVTEVPKPVTPPAPAAPPVTPPPVAASEMTPPPSTLRPQSEMTIEKPAAPASIVSAPEVKTPETPAPTTPPRSTSMMERIRQKGINPPEKSSNNGSGNGQE